MYSFSLYRRAIEETLGNLRALVRPRAQQHARAEQPEVAWAREHVCARALGRFEHAHLQPAAGECGHQVGARQAVALYVSNERGAGGRQAALDQPGEPAPRGKMGGDMRGMRTELARVASPRELVRVGAARRVRAVQNIGGEDEAEALVRPVVARLPTKGLHLNRRRRRLPVAAAAQVRPAAQRAVTPCERAHLRLPVGEDDAARQAPRDEAAEAGAAAELQNVGVTNRVLCAEQQAHNKRRSRPQSGAGLVRLAACAVAQLVIANGFGSVAVAVFVFRLRLRSFAVNSGLEPVACTPKPGGACVACVGRVPMDHVPMEEAVEPRTGEQSLRSSTTAMDRDSPMDLAELGAGEPRTEERPRKWSVSDLTLSGRAAHTGGAAPNAATSAATSLTQRFEWEDMGFDSGSDDGQVPVDNSLTQGLESVRDTLEQVRLAEEDEAARNAAAAEAARHAEAAEAAAAETERLAAADVEAAEQEEAEAEAVAVAEASLAAAAEEEARAAAEEEARAAAQEAARAAAEEAARGAAETTEEEAPILNELVSKLPDDLQALLGDGGMPPSDLPNRLYERGLKALGLSYSGPGLNAKSQKHAALVEGLRGGGKKLIGRHGEGRHATLDQLAGASFSDDVDDDISKLRSHVDDKLRAAWTSRRMELSGSGSGSGWNRSLDAAYARAALEKKLPTDQLMLMKLVRALCLDSVEGLRDMRERWAAAPAGGERVASFAQEVGARFVAATLAQSAAQQTAGRARQSFELPSHCITPAEPIPTSGREHDAAADPEALADHQKWDRWHLEFHGTLGSKPSRCRKTQAAAAEAARRLPPLPPAPKGGAGRPVTTDDLAHLSLRLDHPLAARPNDDDQTPLRYLPDMAAAEGYFREGDDGEKYTAAAEIAAKSAPFVDAIFAHNKKTKRLGGVLKDWQPRENKEGQLLVPLISASRIGEMADPSDRSRELLDLLHALGPESVAQLLERCWPDGHVRADILAYEDKTPGSFHDDGKSKRGKHLLRVALNLVRLCRRTRAYPPARRLLTGRLPVSAASATSSSRRRAWTWTTRSPRTSSARPAAAA